MRWLFGLLTLALLSVVALSSCERTHPGIQPDEMRIAARWLEDVAHGIPRRAGELELTGASSELLHLAQWAGGDDRDGVRSPPLQLRARINRHPSLAAALRSGVALIDAKTGLVGPTPTLSGADQALAAEITDPENRNRRTIDAIVISLTGASIEAAGWYNEAVRAARVANDTADGGTLWQPLDH